jgi:hypothetical protein
VISVILYGRNDAHGYNLHRRAALSLNCLAEILTDPEDEIVFVDYNTPDELPTFVEALSDTLTKRCLELLRILRVRAPIHRERYGARTHLPIVEPVARNSAARRANPANRWLLSTNTDMVFLPVAGQSLSEVCAALPDGFYGLPRFELPEWLWEQLPRSDPSRVLAELQRLGPALRLDEPTISHEWIRFDAPGDFQLVLRDDFFAVDGFDEEMLLGYHVDSNFSRRMLLHRGSIESVGERVAGYHCNHNRTPTVYHGARLVSNDLERFFYSVDRAELPAQRARWGLAGEVLEEVPVRERVEPRFAASVIAAIPSDGTPRTLSDASRTPFALTYDSGHVLPFVADSLVLSPPNTGIGYIGANPALERMLASLVAGLGLEKPLAAANLEDVASVDEVAWRADVLVVDLGVDGSRVDAASVDPARPHEPTRFPAGLGLAFSALERVVEHERARLQLGEHPRRIVLVNSATVFWDPYVLAHLDCSYTTPHSRVRRATVKRLPDSDEATQAALERARTLVRWSTRADMGDGRLPVRAGSRVALGELDDYRGFGEGWALPEEAGVWTQGSRSELTMALDGIGEGEYVLALEVRGVCTGPEESLRVELRLNDEHRATRDFIAGEMLDWRIELPSRIVDDGRARITLLVEDPRSPLALGWSADERHLGILLNGVAVEKVGALMRLTAALGDFVLYLRMKIGFRRHIIRLRRQLQTASTSSLARRR